MGGLPLLRQGEHMSPTRKVHVSDGYRTRNPFIGLRIRYAVTLPRP